MHRAFLPAEHRDEEKAKLGELGLLKPLGVLETTLAGRDYLLGADFSAADLNVACVLGVVESYGKVDISSFANTKRWLDACTGRASFGRAMPS
jgi:glutathione S-transferase